MQWVIQKSVFSLYFKNVAVTFVKSWANLKGQCYKIFCFRFSSWITFPKAPENNSRVNSNSFENSRRYSQVKVQTKLLEFFCLKIFSICHRCQRHRWCTLSREYLREISKKFEMALMIYSGAWGKLIQEKNHKPKISWHCPFKFV